jgi:multidrug transporter EmrE-like cation transporter
MKMGLAVVCVLGFIAANSFSSIQFKYAAEAAGRKALWHFILGNLVGFLGPVALTFALRRANPNIIYALCYGGAFAVLQLVSWRLFDQALSRPQWAGVLLVGLGICLLQVGAKR